MGRRTWASEQIILQSFLKPYINNSSSNNNNNNNFLFLLLLLTAAAVAAEFLTSVAGGALPAKL